MRSIDNWIVISNCISRCAYDLIKRVFHTILRLSVYVHYTVNMMII
jgi:hypothetical protein